MCKRYALYADPALLAREFHVRATAEFDLRFSIAPGQLSPVVRRLQGRPELATLRWGLVPPWSRGPETHISLFNAPATSVLTKAAYREAFRRRRCLVPASGYYAWKETGEESVPYYVRREGQKLMAFAGLWECWQSGGKTIESFTIIVTQARGPVSDIAAEMPALLFPESWDRWLSTPPQQAEELLPLLVAGEMSLALARVSPDVDDPARDGPELIEPVG